MPRGVNPRYFFRGRHLVYDGATLEEALMDLVDGWISRPSLVVHEMGHVEIDLQIRGATVKFEITDAKALDDLRYVGPNKLIEHISKQMGIDERDAMALLDEASAQVIVRAIRDPKHPNAWQADEELDPTKALPRAVPELLRELSEEANIQRDVRRPRNRQGREVLAAAVRSQEKLGLSDTQMARRTGIPRTTLRDARIRAQRQQVTIEQFATRRKGQRLTPEQTQLVRDELARRDNNAAAVARSLGLPARTVRELRARTARTVTGQPRKRHSAQTRAELVDLVRNTGVTATEAARTLGVPPRTARGWVRKARFEE